MSLSPARALALSFAWVPPAFAQDPKKGDHPKVDPVRIDAAIKKGVEYLKTQIDRLKGWEGPGNRALRWDELVLWTFVHAGVPESAPEFKILLKKMLESKLERTYNVSLQAMILEELDRVRFQPRLHQYAQFLADNQCKSGQWGYGDPSFFVDDIPTPGVPRETATPGRAKEPGVRRKPRVLRKIGVAKKRDGPEWGDNSNSQYAALGLRACHDAGIVFPRETIDRAQKHWRDAQHPEEKGRKEGKAWCYCAGGERKPYGSMTAGALGALTIYKHMLGEHWVRDRDLLDGFGWMARHFTVKENPGPPEHDGRAGWNYYYYLYALERAGILFGTETIGGHEWYSEGARVLLEAQSPDGWWSSKDDGNTVWDTCFAILFLRRATRPLEDVETPSSKLKK